MPATLLKHPLETLAYAFDFSANMAPGEAFFLAPGVAGPMLLFGLLQPPNITLTITRVDGQPMGAGDLQSSGLTGVGAEIIVTLAGGLNGVTYFLQVQALTTQQGLRVGQGYLLVTNTLP